MKMILWVWNDKRMKTLISVEYFWIETPELFPILCPLASDVE